MKLHIKETDKRICSIFVQVHGIGIPIVVDLFIYVSLFLAAMVKKIGGSTGHPSCLSLLIKI